MVKKNFQKITHAKKITLIDKEADVSLSRQSSLLGVSRASIYYVPKIDEEDIRIMHTLDILYTRLSFYGSRRLQGALKDEYGICIGRGHIQRLMREMGIEAICPKPNTSRPTEGQQTYPYLLRNLPIIRPNQVWGMTLHMCG